MKEPKFIVGTQKAITLFLFCLSKIPVLCLTHLDGVTKLLKFAQIIRINLDAIRVL